MRWSNSEKLIIRGKAYRVLRVAGNRVAVSVCENHVDTCSHSTTRGLMQELNKDAIATHVAQWLDANGLAD